MKPAFKTARKLLHGVAALALVALVALIAALAASVPVGVATLVLGLACHLLFER